jgi:hypothetical protein
MKTYSIGIVETLDQAAEVNLNGSDPQILLIVSEGKPLGYFLTEAQHYELFEEEITLLEARDVAKKGQDDWETYCFEAMRNPMHEAISRMIGKHTQYTYSTKEEALLFEPKFSDGAFYVYLYKTKDGKYKWDVECHY